MEYEETMAEETQAEDSLPEELVEDPGDNEEELEATLDETGEEEGAEGQEAEQNEKGNDGPKEPGYVQGRIAKAVQKAVAETESRFTAQMQAMEAKYAPIMERMLEMDAQELVRTGKVKDLETARELVRYRQGLPAQQAGQAAGGQHPRNEKGQFTAKQDSGSDPGTMARIDMLKHQAEKIKSQRGLDVISEFNSNPKVKQAIVSGEMDFYDVAEQMRKAGKRPPAPTRSPNGANNIGPMAIENMTDAQFRRLDERLEEGVRFTLKR